MSAFSGRQGRGARRILKDRKREEAQERNANTPDERRKVFRKAGEKK